MSPIFVEFGDLEEALQLLQLLHLEEADAVIDAREIIRMTPILCSMARARRAPLLLI